MNTSIGIDVSAKKLDVVIRVEGKRAKQRSFDNDPASFGTLIAWIGRLPSPRVTMEATGVYYLDLAFALDAAGIALMVVNPRQAKRFMEARAVNQQTDKVDASELSEFGHRMDFVPWQAPAETAFALHKIGRAIGALTKQQTATANRLHAAKATAYTPKVVVKMHQDLLGFLDKQHDKLTRQAMALIDQDASLKRKFELLDSVKGIAETSAIALLAELVVLPEDLSASAWVKMAALDPCSKRSGTSVESKPRIYKRGNARLRGALFMPAMSARRNDPNMRAFADRLLANNKTKMQAIVAVQRKLLHGIHAMFKNNTTWDSSLLAPKCPE